jgi:lantibiotic biosynthesis protein
VNPNPIFLDTAIKISERIIQSAQWEGSKCTWKIYAHIPTDPKIRQGNWQSASANVYQGVAGIGIFLSEFYRVTKNGNVRHSLMGAANFCFDEAINIPFNKPGFHNGRVGIAYFLAIAGKYLEDEKLLKNASDIIMPLKGHEPEDSFIDVIGGAGGAIPALLRIYELTNNMDALEIAFNFGETLIKKANKEPCGWSWGAKLHGSDVRNLCGFAHGAAGIGNAFLELYNVSKSDYYLYAAEQAFLYERNFYSTEHNNWPDFRYTELSNFTSYQRFAELTIALRNNELPPFTPHYMSAWCHGAPGIGLARLRAYELTYDTTYLEESKNACVATIGSLKPSPGNYSLCHGSFGNAETLLEASVVLKDANYSDIAEQKAIEGIEQYEMKSVPWPCGTAGGITDPSLLLGEAGIGYFLLRLADISVPSILAIKSGKITPAYGTSKDNSELRQGYINLYFSNITKEINRTAKKGMSILNEINFKMGANSSDVENAFSYIDNLINSSCEPDKTRLNDLFVIEKEKFLSAKLNTDFSKEYTEKLLIDTDKSFNWDTCRICLHPACKLIKTRYNKDNKTTEETSTPDDTQKEEHYFLLYKENNRINSKEISFLSFTLFSALLNGASLRDIISSISAVFEIKSDQIDTLNEKVKEQILNAYRGNIVKISE